MAISCLLSRNNALLVLLDSFNFQKMICGNFQVAAFASGLWRFLSEAQAHRDTGAESQPSDGMLGPPAPWAKAP